MIRTVENWMKVLGDLPAPEGQNTEQLMAFRIMGDLTGYRDHAGHKDWDAVQLANALVAYARMMFDAKVRP